MRGSRISPAGPVAPTALLDRLNVRGVVDIPVALQSPYGAPVEAYNRTAPKSQCVRFDGSEMITTDLEESMDPALSPKYLEMRTVSPTEELDLMAYYARNYGGGGWDDTGVPINDQTWRCNPDFYPAILPWASNASDVTTYISQLTAHGNTSADTGLRWGVAMLDPAFRSVVGDMVDDLELPQALDGRPFDYDPARFMKVIVLMSDGANTIQHDIRDKFKNGPSTVWFSQMASRDEGPNGEDWYDDYIVDSNEDGYRDRAKTALDGYYILREDYSTSRRWLRPHEPTSLYDGVLYHRDDLPEDAVQLTWDQVFERFSAGHAGLMHYDGSVSGAYNAWYELRYGDTYLVDNEDDGEADRRMLGENASEYGLCDAAKVNNDILIYTIAFKAGTDAENVLRDCATSTAYNFKASNGEALNKAFSTIATSLTTLRMTQ